MAVVSALLAELQTALRGIYPTIAFGLGEKDLARQDSAPPRIVWIPTTVTHAGASKQQTNPKSLITRKPSIVAHCWAHDPNDHDPLAQYDACEALVHNLLVQLHKSAHGSLAIDGEDWMTATHVDLGYAALVTFTPQVPVQARTYETVQLSKLEPNIVGSVAGDSNVDWSET
jgi:hypothetical protein